MKVEVLASFIDKNDHVTELKVGQQIDISDAERCEDLISRGLVKEIAVEKPKPKKTARKAANDDRTRESDS